jgi:succinate dehydrogenase hydrophobic membrane anchor protein
MFGRTPRTTGLAWLLQRVSAVVLAAGLIAHFLVLHFLIDRPVTLDKVADRLKAPCWVAFDLLLLALVLYHGLNGISNILADYAPGPSARAWTRRVLWVLGIAAFAFGVVALVPLTKTV